MLSIYNTLTGTKDPFKPRKGKAVQLFVCGPTVYEYSHLGHARNYLVFDAFAKFLERLGYQVTYLQNITDVDDKIIARAREKGVSPKDLAVAFEKEYQKDMKAIGVTSVKKYARATAHIKEIVSQVKRLLEKGFAYEISGDGVYFDITKFPGYGKLSHRSALQAEDSVSRVDYSRHKRNRGDFCLWKIRQDDSEPSWPSPWGQGRPGWHIEDTAITEKFFGAQYDIHGGAQDLIFPHHEAEVTQMEAISGKAPLAKYWMHVGFLTTGGQKMAKSVGNFVLIRDFLMRYEAKYLRYFCLKNLWRSPIDYTESSMIEVKAAVERLEEFLRKIKSVSPKAKGIASPAVKKLSADFYAALEDDFNTPRAFAVLFDFIAATNARLAAGQVSQKEATAAYKFFQEMNGIFGIIDFKKVEVKLPANIKKIAREREKARQAKDWRKSDDLRDKIASLGWEVEDTPTGPSLKKI